MRTMNPICRPVPLFFHLLAVKKRSKNGIIFAKKPQNLKQFYSLVQTCSSISQSRWVGSPITL